MNQLQLPGSGLHAQKFKLCTKCNESKPPEGGIDLSQSKWYCAGCWIKRKMNERRKP